MSEPAFDSIEIENSLKKYCAFYKTSPFGLFELTAYSQDIDPGIFGIIKDIRINLVFCHIDRHAMALAKKEGDLARYLHYASDFAIRFRAVGDKMMRLLLVLFGDAETKKNFKKSRSKVGCFDKACGRIPALKKFQGLAGLWKELSKQYRDDEVHNMGGLLYKSILTKEKVGINDPIVQLGNYWNILTNPLGDFKHIYDLTLDASQTASDT